MNDKVFMLNSTPISIASTLLLRHRSPSGSPGRRGRGLNLLATVALVAVVVAVLAAPIVLES